MCSRHATIPAAALALTLTITSSVSAQYFGRNKVHYKKFQFQILKTERFDIYFYPEEREGVEIAGRMDKLPGIDDLNDPDYFPYRWGQAFWAYVAGTWGDDVIGWMLAVCFRLSCTWQTRQLERLRTS
jgi:hypothetical protein